MTKGKKKFQPLTSKNICEIYSLLYTEGLVSFPVTNDARQKIEAIVANVTGDSFGTPHYLSTPEKIVAYFYFLIKDHPFTDGNKRTAVLAFLVLCEKNAITQHLIGYDMDELAIFVEQLPEKNHQQIIHTIAKILFS